MIVRLVGRLIMLFIKVCAIAAVMLVIASGLSGWCIAFAMDTCIRVMIGMLAGLAIGVAPGTCVDMLATVALNVLAAMIIPL